MREGERSRFRIAYGGGYGDPRRRPRAEVLADLKNGYIAPEQARRDYGLDPDDGGPTGAPRG